MYLIRFTKLPYMGQLQFCLQLNLYAIFYKVYGWNCVGNFLHCMSSSVSNFCFAPVNWHHCELRIYRLVHLTLLALHSHFCFRIIKDDDDDDDTIEFPIASERFISALVLEIVAHVVVELAFLCSSIPMRNNFWNQRRYKL